MKKFLKRILLFNSILILFFLIVFFLPKSLPKSSLVYSTADRDSLMLNVPSRRIVLLGGSNIGFGINSQILKDSLGYSPINYGVSASLGLKFLLDDSADKIRKGDIIIVIPEYMNYYGTFAYGTEGSLFLRLMYVSYKDIFKMNYLQMANMIPYVGKISFYKLKSYFKSSTDIKQPFAYNRYSYNEYGDNVEHRMITKTKKLWIEDIKGAEGEHFNMNIITMLKDYESKINEIGAEMYISYPSFSESSYNAMLTSLNEIETTLVKNNFKILGTPARYSFPDSTFYDSPFHLLYPELNVRTLRLLEDIKTML